MNFKSIILTICLIASAVLEPQKATASALIAPQKVLGEEHQSHKEVNLLCVREAKYRLKCIENKERKDIQKAQGLESSKSSLTAAMPALNTNGESVALHNQYSHPSTHEVLLIIVIWASTLTFWVLLYNKRSKNRLTVKRQNIEALERLWKISNYK